MPVFKLRSGLGDDISWYRMVTPAKAAPFVTWQQIAEEVTAKMKNGGNELLSTVTFIEHRFIVSQSVRGFCAGCSIEQDHQYFRPFNNNQTFEERREWYAKHLIMERDYQAAGGYFAEPRLNQRDFWPKV